MKKGTDAETAGFVQVEMVDHPAHYNSTKFEVIDIIEEFKLGFHLGNVIKYVLRAPLKGNIVEDLKKARWYLDRYIKCLETPITHTNTDKDAEPVTMDARDFGVGGSPAIRGPFS